MTIVNKLGLHARAAAKFVRVASGFGCEISIVHKGLKVNGKSIMGVITLAAGKNAEIEIITEGVRAKRALTALETLVRDRFGEDR